MIDVDAAWRDALALWGVSIDLSAPEPWRPDEAWAPGRPEPLAYIDLQRRQVVVNFEQLDAIGATACLRAVLAHEIGHHVRFPHTLGQAAALDVLEKRLLPYVAGSRLNLFYDLLVNERVGRTWARDLQTVYRGFTHKPGYALTDAFAFYLAIYEELWGLPEGDLLPPSFDAAAFEAKYTLWRAEARMFAQTFWALTDVYLQFVYFLAVIQRYLPLDGQEARGDQLPMAGDLPTPDVDDYAGALCGGAAVDRALAEAVRRGWIDDAGARRGADGDALSVINRVGGGLPSTAILPFRQALVARHYARLVDRYLFDVPRLGEGREPEPSIPSTTEDWEPGDALFAIDWRASVLARGALAPAMPVKRALLADDPDPNERGVPACEIYLDTSGSMPSPAQGINAMTVAALVLATACIRKGGLVKGIVYSYGPPLVSDWLAAEAKARDFLLQYSGGGTDYPFDVLVDHATARRDAIRVVISDGDFLANVSGEGSTEKLMAALDRTRRFVALLALHGPDYPKQLERPRSHPAFRLAVVTDTSKLAEAAADLARALFGA